MPLMPPGQLQLVPRNKQHQPENPLPRKDQWPKSQVPRKQPRVEKQREAALPRNQALRDHPESEMHS